MLRDSKEEGQHEGLAEHLPSMQEGRGRGTNATGKGSYLKSTAAPLLWILLFSSHHKTACGCSTRYRNLPTQADGDILDLSAELCHYTGKITDILNFMNTTVI